MKEKIKRFESKYPGCLRMLSFIAVGLIVFAGVLVYEALGYRKEAKRLNVSVAKITLKGHWQHFGVAGRAYDHMNSGTMNGIESGLMYFATLSGRIWWVDFEAERTSLDQRQIYMALISSDTSVGCGRALPDFRTAPEKCIVEEKILSWQETKDFFKGQLTPEEEEAGWPEIERFYRRREIR